VTDVVLEVRDLHKAFDPGLFQPQVEVLRGIDLEVVRGEIFGLLGPNGAGKTTTLKAILDLVRPDAGVVRICGHPHGSREARRRVGFMPENPSLYPHLTGDEYLGFCARLLDIPDTEAPARIREVLGRVSMTGRSGRPMRTFSKGMQQRISLAQALLGRPDLLLLDEPMSGLDPLGRRDVRDLILAERERGTTVFFSSHVIPDVEALCDRVALVVDGRVEAVGSVKDLLAQEVDSYEATFVGVTPDALRTPLIATHEGSDASWVRVESADREALLGELHDAGARLLSFNPVRSTLETFLVRHVEGRR
jgi:ABC-2 type transport system ATP-binding protein